MTLAFLCVRPRFSEVTPAAGCMTLAGSELAGGKARVARNANKGGVRPMLRELARILRTDTRSGASAVLCPELDPFGERFSFHLCCRNILCCVKWASIGGIPVKAKVLR